MPIITIITYGKKIFVHLVFVGLLFLLFSSDANAQDYYRETLAFDEEGNLIMTTRDKIATGSLTYKTIGWTIRRYDTGIYDPRNQCAFLPLTTLADSKVDPENPAYQYSYFYCDKETIFQAIGNVSSEWQTTLYTNGGTVFLDAIMTTCHNGVPDGALLDSAPTCTGTVYFTFDGIVNAANWQDPSALFSHYGKNIYFPPNPSLLPEKDAKYQLLHYQIEDSGNLPLSRYGNDVSGTFLDFLTIPIADFSSHFFEFVSGTARITYMDGSSDTLHFDGKSPPTISNGLHNILEVVISLYYKRTNKTENLTLSLNYNRTTNSPDITAQGNITANEANPDYDPSTAIPTSTLLDISTTLDPYAFTLDYRHHYGQLTLSIQITTSYHLVWTDEAGSHSSTETLTETYYVDRSYSFYMLDSFSLYLLNQVRVYQYALENSFALLQNPSPLTPSVSQATSFDSHWFSPSFPQVILADGGTLTGNGEKPDLPVNAMQSLAEASIGRLSVENDHFQMGDTIIMSSTRWEESAPAPELPSQNPSISLTQKGIKIPDFRHNAQKCETRFAGIYKLYGQNTQYTHSYSGNFVSIHTPVVCKGQISNDKKKNQLLQPDESKASLILGQNFYLKTSLTGTHQNYPGYGTKDYSGYVKEIQVKLPFEAYLGDTYLKPDTWHTIQPEQTLYLPTGVKEGSYTIEIRATALNFNSLLDEETLCSEEGANLDPSHLIAACALPVHVMGRLYDFGFTLKDGFHPIGTKDENGSSTNIANSYGIPCHLDNFFEQPLPFSLTTIGKAPETGDGIRIWIRFFHLNEDGTGRQPVKIYVRNNNNTLEEFKPSIFLEDSSCTYAGSLKKNVRDKNASLSSLQLWSGTFTLPKPFLLVPSSVDLSALLEEKGNLSPKDSLFLQDGFLLVNFNIYSVRQGKYRFSYINSANAPKGYCNMWETEGFSYTQNIRGYSFHFLDGDCLLYSLSDNNYRILGTH